MKRWKPISVAAPVLLCVASAGQAQMTWYPPVGIWPGSMLPDANVDSESATANRHKSTRSILGFDADSASRPASAQNLIFRSSPTLRRQNLAAFARKARRVDPQGADAMQQLFASTDVLALADAEMSKMGLRSNNVADAFALWWGTAWLATKGRDDDLAPRQVRAISQQAARGMLNTREFAAATDAQKQEMAEALVIQTMLISASLEMAKGQPAMMPRFKAAVAKGAQEAGLTLSEMTLTDEGFRPVRGSDASGAPVPGGAKPEALAAADETSKEGPNYLLLAAAGGAGFVGVYVLGKRAGRRG